MKVLIDRKDIENYIPHRDPFLFIDYVLELDHGSRILAVKRFGPEEDFFKGHFPGNPIVPGVIIVEALAQAGGVLVYRSFTDELKEQGLSGAYLAGLEKVRFRKVVLPEYEVKLHVRLERRRSKIIRFRAEALIHDSIAVEAEITISLY